jgi:serine/threonine protein phosphatase PrpC
VALSYKHVTKDESEKARIEKLGGLIFNGGRLYGNLAITRALGDMEYKVRPCSPAPAFLAHRS